MKSLCSDNSFIEYKKRREGEREILGGKIRFIQIIELLYFVFIQRFTENLESSSIF